jgi:hypothetical protein
MTKLHDQRQEASPSAVHVGVMTVNSEAAIWTRLIRPEQDDLSSDAARSLLRIEFSSEDKGRMHELALKAQEGSLTPGEQAEMDDYCRVGRLLDLMHSKARRSLKRPAPGA